MRFASSQAARKLTGSLDAAAAVTGHQSKRMTEHYARLDSNELNKSSVLEIERHMRGISKPDLSEFSEILPVGTIQLSA